jgi:hypothetical protein
MHIINPSSCLQSSAEEKIRDAETTAEDAMRKSPESSQRSGHLCIHGVRIPGRAECTKQSLCEGA